MSDETLSTKMSSPSLSRRGFLSGPVKSSLAYLLLSSTGIGLASCSKEQLSDDTNPYTVWKEVQAALKASPDHPIGKAKKVVETGDLQKVFEFVRDDIRLVSYQGERFELGNKTRFGTRAALRAGAGTAIEKIEILKSLVEQVGHSAKIVEIKAPDREDITKLFFRSHEQPFEPLVSERQMANWQTRLGVSPGDSNLSRIDADHPEQDQILNGIKDVIGTNIDNLGRYRYDNRPIGKLPVLQVTTADGERLLLSPFAADATLVPWPENLTFSSVEPANGSMPITVEVSAVTGTNLDTPITLAKAEWDSSVIAGRQVQMGFKTGPDTLAALTTPIQDFRTFVPVLKLQALDGEFIDPETAMIVGDAVTLEGDHIAINANDELTVNGRPAGPIAMSGRAEDVASLNMSINSAFFPEIRASITPRDKAGEIVEGLTAGDFSFEDEGQSVSHIIRTSSPAPNILFLSDQSLSMPSDYRGAGTAMQALVNRVKLAAKDLHPDAIVDLKATQSNLWSQLSDTVKSTRANLIVYATDGDLDGQAPDDKMREILKNGPPVIVINVRSTMAYVRQKYGDNIFDQMAAATQGLALDTGTDGDADLASAITDFLSKLERPAYEISYRARSVTPLTRTAAVTIGKQSKRKNYEVSANHGVADRLSSLRLTITVGRKSITRVLAGSRSNRPSTDSEFDEIRAALLGTHLIAFEGAAPSLSVIWDDFLTARQGLETLDRASISETNTTDEIIDALDAGIPSFPGKLASLLTRPTALSGSDFSIAECGMTVLLHSQFIIPNTNKAYETVDILPLTRTHVIAEQKQTVVERAFERSMQIMRAENALFETSTASLLKDKPLKSVHRRPFRNSGLSEDDVDKWYRHIESLRTMYPHPGAHFIGAEDGSTRALWVVDKQTAEIIGVLPDLSGGGQAMDRIKKQLDELDTVINMLNLAAGIAGVGGVSLGVAAAYGQRLARLYGAVSFAIIVMETSGIAPAVRLAMIGMLCEVVKNISLGVFGGAGKIAGRAVTIWSTHESIVGIIGANSTIAKNKAYNQWKNAISCV